MQASTGTRIVIHGKTVGVPDRRGEITEVRGADGGPPYLVSFDDGHESLVFPGPDFAIQDASRS